jgi:hypothetical protein
VSSNDARGRAAKIRSKIRQAYLAAKYDEAHDRLAVAARMLRLHEDLQRAMPDLAGMIEDAAAAALAGDPELDAHTRAAADRLNWFIESSKPGPEFANEIPGTDGMTLLVQYAGAVPGRVSVAILGPRGGVLGAVLLDRTGADALEAAAHHAQTAFVREAQQAAQSQGSPGHTAECLALINSSSSQCVCGGRQGATS